MRSIRSLLWVGSGRGLAESGVGEAPTLDITWVPDPAAALALPPMILDATVLEGEERDGLMHSLRQLKRRPGTPPILIYFAGKGGGSGEAAQGGGCEATLRELLAAGAHDVMLPPEPGQAPRLLDDLLARIDELAEKGTALPGSRREVPPSRAPTACGRIVGRSRALRDVLALSERAAHSRANVLIHGESGTGKELVAREIHDLGPRSQSSFIAVNCAAIPETLLESELFGHRKGAFTGADRDRPGHFELAHRGTLLLDEIGETSPALQAKLLRAVQEREILPVGAHRPHPVDVRLIVATNRSLLDEIESGRFRQDLYYRLAVFPIPIPPLRERSEDILALARHFLEKHAEGEGKSGCQFSTASQRLLLSHHWPGNIRELENEVQRALALSNPGELIGPRRLSPRILGVVEAVDRAPSGGENLQATLAGIEAWLIRSALERNGGRRAATARKLGVTREALYKKMRRLRIEA